MIFFTKTVDILLFNYTYTVNHNSVNIRYMYCQIYMKLSMHVKLLQKNDLVKSRTRKFGFVFILTHYVERIKELDYNQHSQ